MSLRRITPRCSFTTHMRETRIRAGAVWERAWHFEKDLSQTWESAWNLFLGRRAQG